jgi:HAD superfamily hydrolase (TIGR01509 family)
VIKYRPVPDPRTGDPPPLKALLFDLDGTLAETDSVHFPAWADILRPHGYEVDWAFFKENISGRLNPEVLAEFVPHLAPEEAAAIAEAKEAHFRERAGALEPLPGLVDFVDKGREKGLATLLVTNAPRANALAVLGALGLDDHFETLIVAEDVGAGKPDPAPYKAALAVLGLRPNEAIAFEDSPSGIAAATGAAIPTVGIASTQDPERLASLGARLVARDFTDPKLARFVWGDGGG